MESFFFFFSFIFFLIIWFLLINYSEVKILNISIPGILIISIFIQQYFGYPILFLFLDDYRAEFIQDRSILINMFIITSYSITLLIFGFILASKTFGPLNSKNEKSIFHNPVIQDKQLSRFLLYLIFILSLLVLWLYISKIGLNNLALLSAINFFENDLSTKVLRSNMGNAFDGDYHWYRFFMRDVLSIVSVALYGFYLLRKKLFYLFIFMISFFINIFSTTIAIEKGPLFFYLISIFLMHVLITDGGKFKIKKIIIISCIGLLLVGYIYEIFMGSINIFWGMKSALSRIFLGQIQPIYHYLEIFPKHVDFLSGRSFPNPAGLMPYEPISMCKTVHAIVFPNHADELGIVGCMPAFFWAEMYANFGYVGVIIPPLFIGFFLYGLNSLLLRLPVTPIFLSVYIWIILHYRDLTGTSISQFIIDIKMLIIILFLIIIITAPYNLKFKYLKNYKLRKN